jgi:phosphohistidine swiveling domain-containing protein
MSLTQVGGVFLIFVLCPLLGWLPLIAWITQALTGRRLRQLGTGNVSVSAAFYHGGRTVGILAVLSEALKGIAAVLMARAFFPPGSAWEMVALMALVVGRYWFGGGAGTTNVVWGYTLHDPIAAGLVFLIGGIGFTLFRERRLGRLSILVLFPLITALRHPENGELIGAAIGLAGLLGWIYHKIPDDLDLAPDTARPDSQPMFRFFQSDRSLRPLTQDLKTAQVGAKAATLSELNRLGYPVPMGWVLLPGDDPTPLIASLNPSPKSPLVVRSSAVGEDSETASAAGQYETILSVTSREALLPAISRCFASYDQPGAVQYRRDRNLPESVMAVLVQQQVRGVFSGVAFSRDPVTRQGEAVAIEALPGSAAQVVSGQVTPESYQVWVPDSPGEGTTEQSWGLPDQVALAVQGSGDIPPRLLQQVAYLARHLERHYHGIPQDIEWSYDGQTLWLLQSRPITTLTPIWTRKIAAEVIPGWIRPLTWSINRPLTCGVWGRLFTLVLGDRAQGLDFNQTATLHYSHAYFNATLLGQIFRRMGLPPESLEFLTRGAKFNKPPLASTLKNLPGLVRLAQREWSLERDFQRDDQRQFGPAIVGFTRSPAAELSTPSLLSRIDLILDLLQAATYYSILAPLSAALRKALFKVADEDLDNSATPEVAALRSLQELAQAARRLLEQQAEFTLLNAQQESQLFSTLAQSSDGQRLLTQLDQLAQYYGYLSEVGTDIAVPTWSEDPRPVQALFAQFCFNPPIATSPPQAKAPRVQRRFTLKGRVTEVYSRLLAELRGCFVALEKHWMAAELLELGDIFYLELDEVRQLESQAAALRDRIAQRRSQVERDRQLTPIPYLVYGDDPPMPLGIQTWQSSQQLRGIGASAGIVEGRVKVVRNLTALPEVDRDTILVVPYTDSGWAALLARAGGIVSEVGGRLSHGAIVAREYRIPAVMDIPNATQQLQDGQRIRIDGQLGTVEILSP